MAFNFPALKAANDIADIIGRFLPLTKKGTEYVGMCPWHDDKAPSLHVHGGKQLFFCPVCGDKKGDVVDFLLAWGFSFKEAAEYLHGGPLDKPAPTRRLANKKKHEKPVEWTQLIPEGNTPAPDFKHYKLGKPSAHWTYTTPDGFVWGYVCRFDLPEGGKEVLPLIYATNGKVTGWRWHAFARPRPLLNLHHIKNCETVVVVEGEKTAQAVQRLLGEKYGVTTWTGGTNAVQLTNFDALTGKIVILWADHDAPGRKAMRYISEQIQGKAKQIKYVHVATFDAEQNTWTPDLPKGWDAADGNFDADSLRTFMRLQMQDYNYPEDIDPNAKPVTLAEPTEPPPFDVDEPHTPPVFTAAPKPPASNTGGTPLAVNPWAVPGSTPDQQPPAKQQPPKSPPPPKKQKEKPDNADNPFFKVLGFEMDDSGAVYVFFQKRLNCVVRATIGGLTKNFMSQLAPPTFWELILGEGCKTEHQIQWVIDECGAKLVFSEASIRGRGAWYDEGRAILHAGNKLFVNGEGIKLGDFRTEFIYQAGEKMDFKIGKLLDAKTASQLSQIVRKLKWERKVDADLLAGWVVVAIVCGALDWRPHIWLTGPAGSGKSWVFENIVSRLLGNMALRVQGETTEAGVRQSLGHDARPVLFDENEAEDRKSSERVQSILALMRGASTSDGGVTIKGSSGGSARTYKIRSCFAFASIGIPISQQSDRSRITMLTLEKGGLEGDAWEAFKKLSHETLTEEFTDELRNRVVTMIPTIKASAKIFAKACAVVLGSQRAGDQAGALLAGWYALQHDDVISYENALKIAQSHDWTEEKGHDGTRDETRLFNYLMQQLVKIEADGHFERSIAELCLVAQGKTDHVLQKVAVDKLARLGFKISDNKEFIIISSSMDPITRMLNNTVWSKNHGKILARIEGAKEMQTVRFGVQTTRAVAVPFGCLDKPLDKTDK